MGNIGEALALGGVTTPKDTFSTVLQGMQAGEIMRNRKAEKDAKADEILKNSLKLDPQGYIPAIYGEAVRETERLVKDAQGLKEKFGNRYLNTPEFVQRQADYNYKMANFKEESDKFKALNQGAREGKLVVDKDFLGAGMQSDYERFRSYQNPLTGEGVDPTTGRSNVRGVPSYNLSDIVKDYFNKEDINLYNIEGDQRTFKGTKDYFQLYDIDPETVKKRISIIAKTKPQVLDAYLIDRKAEATELMTKMANDLAAKGEQADPVLLRRAAASQLLENDIMEVVPKSVPLKVDVPQYKPKADDGTEESGDVSDPTQGSITIGVPTYKDGKITKDVKNYDVNTTYQFTAKPVKAGVTASKNVYYLTDGTQASDPGVQQAEYGDYKVLPVYKEGAQGASSKKDIGGRIVQPDDIERAKKAGNLEYKLLAFGQFGDETIYQPASQIKGAALSYGTAKYKAALKKRLEDGDMEAASLNKSIGTNTQQAPANQPAKKQIKRSDIATKAKAAGYSPKEYEQLLITNKVEIID